MDNTIIVTFGGTQETADKIIGAAVIGYIVRTARLLPQVIYYEDCIKAAIITALLIFKSRSTRTISKILLKLQTK